jgi:hypothetical protein
MDYIAFESATNSLWVPGGNTGAVDVVESYRDYERAVGVSQATAACS